MVSGQVRDEGCSLRDVRCGVLVMFCTALPVGLEGRAAVLLLNAVA